MIIRVKLFAALKQRAGRSEIEVELPDEATVKQLRGAIAEQFSMLTSVLAHSRLAVNSDYAADDAVISPAAEIALIPPVSGG